MKKNMGSYDRIIRVTIAFVLMLLNIEGILTGALGIAAVIVSVIFLFTSLFGVCPLYSLLGISTCKRHHA